MEKLFNPAPRNSSPVMLVIFVFSISISVSEAQLTCFKAVAPLNAFAPISVTPSAIVIFSSDAHDEKALTGTFAKLFQITSVTEEFAKALLPTVRTADVRVSLPICALSKALAATFCKLKVTSPPRSPA